MKSLKVCIPDGFEKEVEQGVTKYVKKGEIIDLGEESFRFPAVSAVELISDPLLFLENNPKYIDQFYKVWDGEGVSIFLKKIVYKEIETFSVFVVGQEGALYAWGMSLGELTDLFKKNRLVGKSIKDFSDRIKAKEIAPIDIDDIKDSLNRLKKE